MWKNRAQIISFVGVGLNMLFCIYNMMIGILTNSWWMLTVGTYYVFFSIMRLYVLTTKANGGFVCKFTATLLVGAIVPLAGTIILAYLKDRGIKYDIILMIVIATCSFAKIVWATIKLIKMRKSKSAKMIALKNISFADALVSIFSLQRSMLVSFEGMSEYEIRMMNVGTGTLVCVLFLVLGINLFLCAKRIKKEEDC